MLTNKNMKTETGRRRSGGNSELAAELGLGSGALGRLRTENEREGEAIYIWRRGGGLAWATRWRGKINSGVRGREGSRRRQRSPAPGREVGDATVPWAQRVSRTKEGKEAGCGFGLTGRPKERRVRGLRREGKRASRRLGQLGPK
jgi:hypothetical protein